MLPIVAERVQFALAPENSHLLLRVHIKGRQPVDIFCARTSPAVARRGTSRHSLCCQKVQMIPVSSNTSLRVIMKRLCEPPARETSWLRRGQ
jgi:hypothetical protein